VFSLVAHLHHHGVFPQNTSLSPKLLIFGPALAGFDLAAEGWYEPIRQWAGKMATLEQRFAMGFGLMGCGSRKRLATAVMLAAMLVAAPLALSVSGHSESSESENNRINNFKKRGFAGGVPSDLSSASKVSTKTEIVSSQNQGPMLSEGSAAQMATLEGRYAAIVSSGGFPKVPSGNYKKGSKGKGVIILNQRLFQEGYLRKEGTEGEFAGIFTTATQDAVMRFQRNMGMNASGRVDGATLAQLNVPAETRLRTIQSNIARLQTYGQGLNDRYLIVNVPSQQLETVANGKVFSRHNVIVGRPERPTPVVMTALQNVSFNPYWNAPVSIVEKDIIPKLITGSNIIEDLNIKIFDGFGGPEVDPDSVDWRNVAPDKYFFREEPGPKSAMATAKINFNSPFGIYLHDTPDKQLFASSTRFYSSGCVRVENMPLLVQWVINDQEGIGAPEISALAETLEQKVVTLAAPPQLRVTYLTAWPVGSTVAFRSDVYGLDGTGFVTGQPMPVGEVSDDGQRFVLKPVPRKASAVEAAEAEGFSIFGSGRSFLKKGPKKGNNSTTSFFGKPKAKSAGSNADEDAPVLVSSSASSKMKPKPSASKKKHTGLFDWASYRKDQGTGGAVDSKKAKPKKKLAATKPTAPTPKLKPADKKTVVIAKASDTKTMPAIKPAEKPKTVAVNCKTDLAGKNCKAPTPKPKPTGATTAAN
jgi:L,D-transpeptidase YcbB